MAQALAEQLQMRDLEGLAFEERLGLLVDREMTERHNRKLQLRLKKAHLRQNAVVEDIDFRSPRGLDKSMILGLSSCRWVAEHHNVLITGPTGVGKSYLACALAQKACREGYRAQYYRMPVNVKYFSQGRGKEKSQGQGKEISQTRGKRISLPASE